MVGVYPIKQFKNTIMKKVLTGVIAIAGFIFSANAQQRTKTMDKPQHHQRGVEARKEGDEDDEDSKWDMLKERLNLSNDQVSKLKATQEAYHVHAQAIRANNQYTAAEKTQKLRELQGVHKESYEKLLTPAQLTKMTQYQKEERKDLREKKHFRAEKKDFRAEKKDFGAEKKDKN